MIGDVYKKLTCRKERVLLSLTLELKALMLSTKHLRVLCPTQSLLTAVKELDETTRIHKK
jgi:hypothetical protein